jgi:nicotinate-nucleotide adenylyltransferase
MDLALFGTSADPPTVAHQQIIQWLGSQFQRVAVWASDNPFKQHAAPLAQRSEMLQCLVTALSQPSISVEPDLSSPRAFETLGRARQRWPQAQLTFVVGSDLVAQIPRWYRASDLVRLTRFLIVPRPYTWPSATDLQRLSDLGAEWVIAPLTVPSVSSTAYRQQAAGEVIPPAVRDYIEAHGLYRPLLISPHETGDRPAQSHGW